MSTTQAADESPLIQPAEPGSVMLVTGSVVPMDPGLELDLPAAVFPANFQAESGDPAIVLSMTDKSFIALTGGYLPPQKGVWITNAGAGTLGDLSATVRYLAGEPSGWLDTSVYLPTPLGRLYLQPNTTDLQPGDYHAVVRVHSTTAINSPQKVFVTYTVLPPASAAMGLSRASRSFTAEQQGTLPAAKTVLITNAASGPLRALWTSTTYASGAGCGWLDATLDRTSAPATLTLRPRTTALSSGFYQAWVCVGSEYATNGARSVSVSYTVTAPSQYIEPEPTPPLLLCHYKFNGNADDDLGLSPPMELSENVSFTNDTLSLPRVEGFGSYSAAASIRGFSYHSFTVSFDFQITFRGEYENSLISGGPLYRWFGIHADTEGRLFIALNNWGRTYAFTNVLHTSTWHTIVCAVDLSAQTIITFLNGRRLPDIHLQAFCFNVLGTSYEPYGKVFSFWNHGNMGHFTGYADNLRVYSRALTAGEITSLYSPQLTIVHWRDSILVHWPADLKGYVLESASGLDLPLNWATEPLAPVTIGSERMIVDDVAPGRKFYRLRRF